MLRLSYKQRGLTAVTHIVAIINQKGGVGKTTTAINLATCLEKSNKSVLLVDLDPQGNATSGLGVPKQSPAKTTYDLLLGTNVTDIVLEIERLGIQLVPATPELAAAEVELASMEQRETRLKHGLANTAYDYVLIDCPPSLGLLTINALTAAHWVLIPVQAEYYALEGLSQLLGVIQRVRKGLNPNLELLGVLATMFDSRTSLADQVYKELRNHFGTKLFETVIPRNVRLAEAPSYGKTILEHDKWSKGARSYRQFAKEFIART